MRPQKKQGAGAGPVQDGAQFINPKSYKGFRDGPQETTRFRAGPGAGSAGREIQGKTERGLRNGKKRAAGGGAVGEGGRGCGRGREPCQVSLVRGECGDKGEAAGESKGAG
jgi:hypothetical protein